MMLRNRRIWSVAPLALGALAFVTAAQAGQRHHHRHNDGKAPAPVVQLEPDVEHIPVAGPEGGPIVALPVTESKAEAKLIRAAQTAATPQPAFETPSGAAVMPAPTAENSAAAAFEVAYAQTTALPAIETSEARIPAPVVTVPIGTDTAGVRTRYSNGPVVPLPRLQ